MRTRFFRKLFCIEAASSSSVVLLLHCQISSTTQIHLQGHLLQEAPWSYSSTRTPPLLWMKSHDIFLKDTITPTTYNHALLFSLTPLTCKVAPWHLRLKAMESLKDTWCFLWVHLCFVSFFFHLFYFLVATCKWELISFVFPFLTYFTKILIMPSRYVHVVAKGKGQMGEGMIRYKVLGIK